MSPRKLTAPSRVQREVTHGYTSSKVNVFTVPAAGEKQEQFLLAQLIPMTWT